MRVTLHLSQIFNYTKKHARLVTGVLFVDLTIRSKSEAAICPET